MKELTDEEYDAMWDAYDDIHAHCPLCGSVNFSTTLAGRHGEFLEDCYDRNRCRCLGCGWVGIRHDMV